MGKLTPAEGVFPTQPENGQTWSLDPLRRNRWRVRLLLALLGRSAPRLAILRRLRRGLRDALCNQLGSDFKSTDFGPRLFLPHPFGIVVHARVRLGRRVTLFQNVTLGEDNERPGVPVLGDDIIVGAGAVILGAVTIGSGARIGANAVVLRDIPEGAVAVGIPARVVRTRAT